MRFPFALSAKIAATSLPPGAPLFAMVLSVSAHLHLTASQPHSRYRSPRDMVLARVCRG
jgi:hypothetical protein